MVAPTSRLSSRRRPLLTQLLTFARIGLLLWLQFLFPVDTQAQRVALHLGERIRVTWGEIPPGEDADWLFGHVVDATSKSPISILPDGRTQPTAVILDETSQVQRYAGKTVPWMAGGVGGGLIGAIVGAAA
ncbi:MAG: hypothetical protein OEY63_00990, partial [Gemmatimonadota bacterium]|nr:hypothetical protein [Gemmatimonadota bacterium]